MLKILKNDKYECKMLNWDSDYFEVNSAKVTLYNELNELDKIEIEKWMLNYRFITIVNLNSDKKNNEWIGNYTRAHLADVNIQFTKEILVSNSDIEYKNLILGNNIAFSNEIMCIASESFKYSRFFNDTKLASPNAEKIYSIWTKNSFMREEKYFVVSKCDNYINGYIIFNINVNEESATIELIAIKNGDQGKGVGKKMINGLEQFLSSRGVRRVLVGTQVENVEAINFYSKCNFHLNSISSVYHLWNEV